MLAWALIRSMFMEAPWYHTCPKKELAHHESNLKWLGYLNIGSAKSRILDIVNRSELAAISSSDCSLSKRPLIGCTCLSRCSSNTKLVHIYRSHRSLSLSIACEVPDPFLMGELALRTEPSYLVHFHVRLGWCKTWPNVYTKLIRWVLYMIYMVLPLMF